MSVHSTASVQSSKNENSSIEEKVRDKMLELIQVLDSADPKERDGLLLDCFTRLAEARK